MFTSSDLREQFIYSINTKIDNLENSLKIPSVCNDDYKKVLSKADSLLSKAVLNISIDDPIHIFEYKAVVDIITKILDDISWGDYCKDQKNNLKASLGVLDNLLSRTYKKNVALYDSFEFGIVDDNKLSDIVKDKLAKLNVVDTSNIDAFRIWYTNYENFSKLFPIYKLTVNTNGDIVVAMPKTEIMASDKINEANTSIQIIRSSINNKINPEAINILLERLRNLISIIDELMKITKDYSKAKIIYYNTKEDYERVIDEVRDYIRNAEFEPPEEEEP